MGLFGFGKSKEQKAAEYILRRIDFHLRDMFSHPSIYNCISSMEEKNTVEEYCGAAMINHMVNCLMLHGKPFDIYMEVAQHLSPRVRSLVEECSKKQNGEVNDEFEFKNLSRENAIEFGKRGLEYNQQLFSGIACFLPGRIWAIEDDSKIVIEKYM